MKERIEDSKFYNLEQVAQKCNVHVDIVRYWVRNGRLKTLVLRGFDQKRFVDAVELERFMQSVRGVQSDGKNEK